MVVPQRQGHPHTGGIDVNWHPLVSLYKYLYKNYPKFQGCGPCPYRPLPFAMRRPSFPAPSFPVDLIYTWVDGKDEKHLAKREAWSPEKHERHHLSQGSALFADNEELRYSLRSVQQYAPWVRNIFILTDNQVPAWLNTGHEKIRVVDHKDCIPAEYLPTFNSHVIEAYLHRIPGLAEHYIYLNDDFFLATECAQEDFFTPNGLPYLFLDWRHSRRHGYAKADTPHACSYANTRECITSKGLCPKQDVISAHVPYPGTKNNAREAYAFYSKEIRNFSSNRFRGWKEMAFYSHCLPHWSYMHGKSVPVDLPFYYINTARFDRKVYYDSMLREKDSGVLPLFFCLNDVGEPHEGDVRHEDMRRFLEAFFPSPSQFEGYCDPAGKEH